MVIDDLMNKKVVLSIQKPEESMTLKVSQSLPEALRLAADLAERMRKFKLCLLNYVPKILGVSLV